MIRATMNWEQLRMEIEGHAGYGRLGTDIVCAGVSALTYALAGSLEEAKERGRTSMEFSDDDDKILITADPNMGSRQEIKAYFRMAVKGFGMMREQYPMHIDIKEV